MKTFNYEKITDQKYLVRTGSGRIIGELLMDVDGYFYFWLDDNNSCWPAYQLKEIAEELDKINKLWDLQCEEFANMILREKL